MRNIKFYILIILFFFILEILSKKIITDKYQNIFDDKTVSIYKKYAEKTNHLRDPLKWKSSELIFSKLGKGKKVLIQGDSWVEEIYSREKTREKLNKFANKNNIEFIISGTTSYSPSLYNAQFNILRDEFSIEPKIVLTFFDQTDIGDELCRYKNQIFEENNKFFVKPYDEYSDFQVYNSHGILKRIDIINEKSFYLIKITKIAFLKINERLNRKINIKKCDFKKDILKYLEKKPDQQSLMYVKKLIERYLNNLIKSPNIEKIILLTHPHKQHLTKNFSYNISMLLNEVLEENNYQKVSLYSFEKKINTLLNEKSISKIMKKDDIASHPTPDHYEYIVNEIIILIKNLI